jgi:hypothetical protein
MGTHRRRRRPKEAGGLGLLELMRRRPNRLTTSFLALPCRTVVAGGQSRRLHCTHAPHSPSRFPPRAHAIQRPGDGRPPVRPRVCKQRSPRVLRTARKRVAHHLFLFGCPLPRIDQTRRLPAERAGLDRTADLLERVVFFHPPPPPRARI